VKDEIKSVGNAIANRMSNPILGGYILTWSIYNWDVWVIAFTSGKSANKIKEISESISSIWDWLLPLGILLIYIVAFPRISSWLVDLLVFCKRPLNRSMNRYLATQSISLLKFRELEKNNEKAISDRAKIQEERDEAVRNEDSQIAQNVSKEKKIKTQKDEIESIRSMISVSSKEISKLKTDYKDAKLLLDYSLFLPQFKNNQLSDIVQIFRSAHTTSFNHSLIGQKIDNKRNEIWRDTKFAEKLKEKYTRIEGTKH